jgi:hypothetical protein
MIKSANRLKTSSLSVSSLAVAFLFVTLECIGRTTSKAKPSPVEVFCGGDDGLTSRLRDASEQAFNATSDLPLATTDRHAVYEVVIPTNVNWKQVGGRTKVLYTIDVLKMDDKKIGTFKGACWESAIRRCGTQIVDGTRKLLATINDPE